MLAVLYLKRIQCYDQMAFIALKNNPNRLLSFRVKNDEKLPSTVLPVFSSPAHAIEFRDSVLKFTDTQNFEWTLSICRQTNEVSLCSSVRERRVHYDMISKEFDVHDNILIDELITRNIGCVAIDSYKLNLHIDQLRMDGSIWIPNDKN